METRRRVFAQVHTYCKKGKSQLWRYTCLNGLLGIIITKLLDKIVDHRTVHDLSRPCSSEGSSYQSSALWDKKCVSSIGSCFKICFVKFNLTAMVTNPETAGHEGNKNKGKVRTHSKECHLELLFPVRLQCRNFGICCLWHRNGRLVRSRLILTY